jgi:hypothetical protein
MVDVSKAELALESVTFPLFGNRASYYGIQLSSTYLRPTLRHLSSSLTERFRDMAVFEPWLKILKSLTFLGDSHLKRLIPKRLEQLCLLDPRHLWIDGYTGRAGH